MKEIWKTVQKNIHLSLSDMDKTCTRTNRELVYGAIACTAVGMVLGIFFSPKKSTTIGSNNANNSAGYSSQYSENEEDSDE